MFMGRKKNDNDIHCSDRALKNLIDDCYHGKPEWDSDYECRIRHYVEEGIKYRKLLRKLLDEGYAKHHSDQSCDIPDYKSFLALEQSMIDAPSEYHDKVVCVEGYVAYHSQDYRSSWTRDNAAIFIYPLPCASEAEKSIIFSLCDDLLATEAITLVSDSPLPTGKGLHIRVHGTPHFYKTPGGDKAAKVHILVQKYEIVEREDQG